VDSIPSNKCWAVRKTILGRVSGGPRQVANAARPLSEFIREQLTKARRNTRKRRPLSTPPIDTRLWLDDQWFAAWTLAGHLVTIEEAKPGQGAMPVRLATQDEIHDLLAGNRFIPTAISLYPGDDVSTGNVTRFFPDHRLEQALVAALARALEDERERARRYEEPPLTPRETCGFKPNKRSRFRPDGNFIVYREAAPELGLRDFVIDTLGGYVPTAFGDRRKAERFVRKHVRRRRLPDGCKIARVLACAKVRPVVRPGFRRPRKLQTFIEQIRKEPRIVKAELNVEWLPRYRQGANGEWGLEEFKIRRTVRQGVNRMVLNELREASIDAARIVEEAQIRRAVEPAGPVVGNEAIDKTLRKLRHVTWVDQDMVDEMEVGRQQDLANFHVMQEGRDLEEQLRPFDRVARRAERRLPAPWQARIGLEDLTFGSPWLALRDQAGMAVENETGHWIRAPFEFGKPVRSQLVELRIDDLAELLENHGVELEFWMITDEVGGEPQWVLPASASHLAIMCDA
jgi:hypothetical protein